MKTPIALLLGLLFLAPPLAFATERSVQFTVEKMTCFLCPFTIKKAIKKVDGVVSVHIERRAKRATVRFDDARTTPEQIAQAVTRVGYPTTPITELTAP